MKILLFKNLTQEAQKRALKDHRDHMAENKKSMKPQEAFDYWNESIYEFYENGVHLAFEKSIYQMQISEDTQEQNLCVHVGEHLVGDNKPRYTRWLYDTEGFQVYEKGQWHDAQSIDWDDIPPATQEEISSDELTIGDNPYTRLQRFLSITDNNQPHEDLEALRACLELSMDRASKVVSHLKLEETTPNLNKESSDEIAGQIYKDDAYMLRDLLKDHKHIISGTHPALPEPDQCPNKECKSFDYKLGEGYTDEDTHSNSNTCNKCGTLFSANYKLVYTGVTSHTPVEIK